MSPKKDNWLKMKHWFNWNDFSFFSFLFCLLWLLHTLLFILSRAALQILSTCFDSLSQDWLHLNSIWMISNIIISHQYIINTAVHYSFWMILHRFHSANVTNEVFRQSGFAARDLAGRLTIAARNVFLAALVFRRNCANERTLQPDRSDWGTLLSLVLWCHNSRICTNSLAHFNG